MIVGHDGYVHFVIICPLEKGPSQPGIELSGGGCVEEKAGDAERSRLLHDAANKGGADTAAAVLGRDKDSRKPWGQFRPDLHVVNDEFCGTEKFGTIECDKNGRDAGAIGIGVETLDAAFDRIAGPEMMPLLVGPEREGRNEVQMVREVIDLHGACQITESCGTKARVRK